jgi:hypothetical protein
MHELFSQIMSDSFDESMMAELKEEIEKLME